MKSRIFKLAVAGGVASASVLSPLASAALQPSDTAASSSGIAHQNFSSTHANSLAPVAGDRTIRDHPGWKLDMVEDFNGISSTRWNVRNNTYSSNESSYLLAANTSTKDGVLRIQGKKQSVGGRDYTSGYIDTNSKYALPNYFRLKVRARVPMEQGMWAAPVWFRPADFSAGEIDLLETYGKDNANPLIIQTLHTDYTASHQQSAKATSYGIVGGDPTAWHRYVIEKTPGKIVMWVDGIKTATWTSGNPGWFDQYYEAGKRWNLRVNLQIGGSWGGLPDSTTDWSGDKTTMQIGHIYTWVRDGR
jgi:hypothetical protein